MNTWWMLAKSTVRIVPPIVGLPGVASEWMDTVVIRQTMSREPSALSSLDFHQSLEVDRLVGSEMNAIFRRLSNFLNKALEPKWRNALEETSHAFGLADLISQRWNRIGKVRLFLISNRELSERVDGRNADELDGRTVTYSVWDLRRLYRFATMGHGQEAHQH